MCVDRYVFSSYAIRVDSISTFSNISIEHDTISCLLRLDTPGLIIPFLDLCSNARAFSIVFTDLRWVNVKALGP